jgi:DNA-directed RNA polymerase
MDDMNAVQGAARAAQLEREQAMRERGQHRAKKAIQKSLERGEAAETPAGVILAKRAIAPLADAIRTRCGPQKGAGRKHTAAKLLAGVDPELAAYVTVRGMLGHANGRKSLHSAAMFVTEILEGELIADGFEAANGALYRSVIRNAEARGLSLSRQMKAVGLANRRFNLVEKPWTLTQRAHLGTKLIELAIETLGIVRVFRLRSANKVVGHYLEFTPEIADWMATYNDAAALTRPLLLPTVIPPKPWEGTRIGAYHTPGFRGGSIVMRPFPGQLDALEEATEAGAMAPVYKGLNAIRATPWRVNKRVLAVMQEAWERNLAGLPLPPRESEPKPEAPPEVVNDMKGGEHRRCGPSPSPGRTPVTRQSTSRTDWTSGAAHTPPARRCTRRDPTCAGRCWSSAACGGWGMWDHLWDRQGLLCVLGRDGDLYSPFSGGPVPVAPRGDLC